MTSLIDMIRARTGVTADQVADVQIVDALAAHRMDHVLVPVDFDDRIGPGGLRVFTRGHVCAWGAIEPSTDATAGALDQLVQTSRGYDLTGWTLDTRGRIIFTADQYMTGTIYWTGSSYDVACAAAAVLERAVSLILTAGSFQDGDQKFSPGEGRDAMLARAAALRAEGLPVMGRMVRGDSTPSPRGRRPYRSRGGNDR